jgi:16S rRNA (guanine966-N2)-methyltransferase
VPATEVAGWLAAAAANGWLADGAVVVVERAGRDGEFPWPAPLQAGRVRRYGDTTLHTAVLPADR